MTDYAELIDRLSGKYRVGQTNESGEPEFGYRQFPAPLVQLEAATALETLLEERNEWQAWAADGFAINEEKVRLTAENARLREVLLEFLHEYPVGLTEELNAIWHRANDAVGDYDREGEPND